MVSNNSIIRPPTPTPTFFSIYQSNHNDTLIASLFLFANKIHDTMDGFSARTTLTVHVGVYVNG